MIIKEGRTAYEGNSITQYNWVVYQCDICLGEGMEPADKTDLMVYLTCLKFGKNFTFRQLRAEVRQWRQSGKKIICQGCYGQGQWEERW